VPPNPTVEAIWFDQGGLLWVSINVPDSAWREAVYERGVLQGKPLLDVTSPNAYYDGVLEVIDVKGGKLVGHGRMTQAISTASGNGWVVTFGGGNISCECIEIWKPQLLQPAR
jgi:hypothetical protein